MRGFVRGHPVASYYVLAFAITSGAIVLVVGPKGLFGTAETILVARIVGLSGPSVAGVVLTGFLEGRQGYRALWSRLRRWRVGGRWYAVALLTGPAVMAASVFGLAVVDTSFVPAIVTDPNTLRLVGSALAAGALVGVFEELGWTGFATPRLLERHSVLATGLGMGVLWSIWHFPFFSGSTDPAGAVPSWLLVTVMLCAWLPPYRVLMVWLYQRTESVLLVILMHAPIVACQYLLAAHLSGTGRVVLLLSWGIAFWTLALIATRAATRSAIGAPAGRAPAPRQLVP